MRARTLPKGLRREKGILIKVGKFPFTASGKAAVSAATEGFVKVISKATIETMRPMARSGLRHPRWL